MTDDYLERLRLAADTPITHGADGLTLAPMAVVAQNDLRASLDEVERLRKDVAKLGEHVAPVDDREPMNVNWAAEALYAYAAQRSTQSQFGNQLRAVLDSRQSWRYRAFKLEDDVEQLRAKLERYRGVDTAAKELLARNVEFGTRADNAEAKCEDLSDEVDRLRAQVGEEEVSWAVCAGYDADGDEIYHSTAEEYARDAAAKGTPVTKWVTRVYPTTVYDMELNENGEWREVGDGRCLS